MSELSSLSSVDEGTQSDAVAGESGLATPKASTEPSTDAASEEEHMARRRREKRLAMNRASARARRKKKKVVQASLEKQVAELKKKNHEYQLANERLTARVEQLEKDHALAQSALALANQQPSAAASKAGSVTAPAASIPPSAPLFNPQDQLGLEMAAAGSPDDVRRLLQAEAFRFPALSSLSADPNSSSSRIAAAMLAASGGLHPSVAPATRTLSQQHAEIAQILRSQAAAAAYASGDSSIQETLRRMAAKNTANMGGGPNGGGFFSGF